MVCNPENTFTQIYVFCLSEPRMEELVLLYNEPFAMPRVLLEDYLTKDRAARHSITDRARRASHTIK